MKKKKYPVRIPRFAAGIRAQETRAGAGRTWWHRRWVSILESMGLGGRLGRGKNYALSGQITGMKIAGPHVEEAFKAEGYDLFPGGRLAPGKYDMTVSCSCPDYANPCKHTAAVLLILGEEVARRPSTLLELRGITLEELAAGEVRN